jgi:hypothetical protein
MNGKILMGFALLGVLGASAILAGCRSQGSHRQAEGAVTVEREVEVCPPPAPAPAAEVWETMWSPPLPPSPPAPAPVAVREPVIFIPSPPPAPLPPVVIERPIICYPAPEPGPVVHETVVVVQPSEPVVIERETA